MTENVKNTEAVTETDKKEEALVEDVQKEKKTDLNKKKKLELSIYEFVSVIMAAFIIITVLFVFAFRVVGVKGESMEDTLHNNDWLITMQKSEYVYGDIVVITEKTELADGPLIKRVIATSGQTIDIDYSTSTVFVDGKPLSEPYVKEAFLLQSLNDISFPYTVPEGEVFCMGDNRNYSGDSRVLGSFNEKYIMGKAVIRLLPFGSFDIYENFDSEK